MKSTDRELLKEFQRQLATLSSFQSALSLLTWDRETYMPVKALPDRGQTLAVLSGFYHQLLIKPEFVKLVEKLVKQPSLPPMTARAVELVQRDQLHANRLPVSFVEESQRVLNAAHGAWVEAKTSDKFEIFAPHLERVIELKKRYATYVHPDWSVYDVCLDQYEEGLKTAQLLPLLAELREGLKNLVPKILAKPQLTITNPLKKVQFDRSALTSVVWQMAKDIGFDIQAGNLSHVAHPFEITLSHHDVRLNTHFDVHDHSFTVMSTIHELGHGLYEQWTDEKLSEWSLDRGVTLGIHESQSRLLENMIGRSEAFWSYLWPKLLAASPDLNSFQPEQMVTALNHVKPSLIRTEADEVTYNLHIILRVEAEQLLLTDQLKVKELPEYWRTQMKSLLGIEPPTNREGVLQDVHWSWGDFGYFPTYTLGNLNSAQLWKAFIKDHPKWADEVRQGNFTHYFQWFQNNIWQHGSLLKASEVMYRATGQQTQVQPFLEYLEQKYL